MNWDNREYTQDKENLLIELAMKTEDDDYDERIVHFLNNEIRPFSERLLFFYNDHLQVNLNPKEAKTDLLNRAEKHDIDLKSSRNTILYWFTGVNTPRIDNTAREILFKIAFSLDLDVSDTERLFNAVYLDRAFNYRSVVEFIYMYCLQFGRSYNDARRLIDMAEAKLRSAGPVQDKTVYTSMLQNYLWSTSEDDKDLLDFILRNRYNFTDKNMTGSENFRRLWQEITGSSDTPGLAAREANKFNGSGIFDLKNKSRYSDDFALYIIQCREPAKKIDGATKLNSVFRDEISKYFPNKHSIKNPESAYILRKNLIFAYFYWFWVKLKLEDYDENAVKKESLGYKDFLDGINDLFEECAYSPLYPGNPYDALFLHCAYTSEAGYDPLDIFREIINTERIVIQ